jgi:hypothetical protein
MMMMKTNPVRPAPYPTYSSYFHPIWMIWKIRNMVGTHWELKGNTVGTHIVNQGKNEKNSSPHPLPPQNFKGKNSSHLGCILGLPIGCMKFLFPKEFITIFGLG